MDMDVNDRLLKCVGYRAIVQAFQQMTMQQLAPLQLNECFLGSHYQHFSFNTKLHPRTHQLHAVNTQQSLIYTN